MVVPEESTKSMMQNALKQFLNSKMAGSFGQPSGSDMQLHDAQYQALVASFLNGNSPGSNASVVDGSSRFQQTSHLDHYESQKHKRKQQQPWIFPATPQPALNNHNPLINGVQREPHALHVGSHKKPRLDVNEEAVLKEHVFQKMLQSQKSAELESDQIKTLFQHNIAQYQYEQEYMNAAAQLGGVNNKKKQQMRHPVPRQEIVNQVTPVHQAGVCTLRLMEYIYHFRNRPKDNNLAFWKKFVAEFYDSCAKKTWCVSSYEEAGQHSHGISPHATTVSSWQCGLCGCQSGTGFETNFEVLPRLNKVLFEGGLIDEFLFLDLARERRRPSGFLMLEHERAIQESVYEHHRVVHEGRLRIIFTPNLKILSWEFCAYSHEVFLRQVSVAPQITQLVHAVSNYQCPVDDRSYGVSSQDVQADCNRILEAGLQIKKALDLDEIDDFGYSKSYSRCLQMAVVVDSMKDLMTLCQANGCGPIENLRSYCRDTATTKLQKKEIKGRGDPKSAQWSAKDQSAFLPVNDEGLNQCTSSKLFQGPKTLNSGVNKSSVAIESFLQQIMNRKTAYEHSRNDAIWGSGRSSSVDLRSGVWGLTEGADTQENVLAGMPVRSHRSNAASTRNLSEVHGNSLGKLCLPGSVFNASYGYHDPNRINDNENNNMSYGWKA